MVNFNDFFYWDANIALVYVILSIGVWVIASTAPELKDKIKSPKLLGLVASLISGFSLGLYAIVPAFVFIMVSYSLEYWLYKFNKKE